MPTILLSVPHRLQQYRADCLATCAAMVLDYIGVQVRYERLMRLLKVQSMGASGSNLHFLTELDIDVAYDEGSMDILANDLAAKLPCIALARTNHLRYWQESTHHALVVVGIDCEFVYLNDPAFAEHPIKVTHVEFELAWMEFDYRFGVLTTGSSARA